MVSLNSGKLFGLLVSANVILLVLLGSMLIQIGNSAQNPLKLPFFDSNGGVPIEQPSPIDHIKEEQIHVYENRIIIDLQGAHWSSFANTNSMDPLIDETSNGIEITPTSYDQVQVGDVVSYESRLVDGIVIHRVVEIGEDERGRYYILKGDNNDEEDPERVRFEQIKGVLVGILY